MIARAKRTAVVVLDGGCRLREEAGMSVQLELLSSGWARTRKQRNALTALKLAQARCISVWCGFCLTSGKK